MANRVFVVLVSIQHLQMYSSQNNEFRCFFARKSRLFPPWATPNEDDWEMEYCRRMTEKWMIVDQWRMNKASRFYFACLTTVLLHQLQFLCFFADKNSSPLLKQQWPELAGFCNSWHDVTNHICIQKLWVFLLHWLTVYFIVHPMDLLVSGQHLRHQELCLSFHCGKANIKLLQTTGIFF